MARDLVRAARNACVGDGTFWKHPGSRLYNVVFTGTNKCWITYKAATLLGGRPVYLARKAGAVTVWKDGSISTLRNDAWCTKSLVDPIFTKYRKMDKLSVISEFDLSDLAMWFLDDGCTITRKDYIRADGLARHRYILCVGSVCNTAEKSEQFLSCMSLLMRKYVTVSTPGSINKNNSRANENNRVWNIPVRFGEVLVDAALAFNVPGFERKLRSRSTFNDHPERE